MVLGRGDNLSPPSCVAPDFTAAETHDYAFTWLPDRMDGSVNGVAVKTAASGPFDPRAEPIGEGRAQPVRRAGHVAASDACRLSGDARGRLDPLLPMGPQERTSR
jgi:hypothetical protein